MGYQKTDGGWADTDSITLAAAGTTALATGAVSGSVVEVADKASARLTLTVSAVTGTKAVLRFTPASAGSDVFDYAAAAAQTFTLNDGSGVQTVLLDADYVNLAGVVAAVDADLTGLYVVTAVGATVQIEASVAGAITFTLAGTDAALISGSANYVKTAGLATGSATIAVQTSSTAAGTYATVASFTAATGAGAERKLFAPLDRFVRLNVTAQAGYSLTYGVTGEAV